MKLARQLITWIIGTVLLSSATTLLAAPASAASPEDVQNYPAMLEGQKRVMISLPAAQHEEDLRVELIVGRSMWVGCHPPIFSGNLVEKTMAGSGAPYYGIDNLTGRVRSGMSCPPIPAREIFTRVQGTGWLLQYNSSQPLVVYVPAMLEVRYRLWHAAEEIHLVSPRTGTTSPRSTPLSSINFFSTSSAQ